MLEDPTVLEGFKIILYCIQILSILALISFILYSLLLYVNYYGIKNFETIKIKFIKDIIILVRKLSYVYVIIWGSLTLYSIIVILYLAIKLTKYLI